MPTTAGAGQLLGPDEVPDHLVRRGIIPGDVACTVEELAGGVSGLTLRVTAGPTSVVVKQSLERLRVPQEWTAPRERLLVEAAGLTAWARVDVTRVPTVLDVDRRRLVLVMSAAPMTWTDLKSELRTRDVDPAVGQWLGTLLRQVQDSPVEFDGSLLQSMRAGFQTLRIEPYLRSAARQLPQLSSALLATAEQLTSDEVVLVHGDFSPKNVLLGTGHDGWVIDHEVSHVGDPRFDAAFMLSHLHAKAIADPVRAVALDGLARCFVESWDPDGSTTSAQPLTGVVGALLAARAAGRSRLEYWSEPNRLHAVRLAERLLQVPYADHDDVARMREDLR